MCFHSRDAFLYIQISPQLRVARIQVHIAVKNCAPALPSFDAPSYFKFKIR